LVQSNVMSFSLLVGRGQRNEMPARSQRVVGAATVRSRRWDAADGDYGKHPSNCSLRARQPLNSSESGLAAAKKMSVETLGIRASLFNTDSISKAHDTVK